MTDNTKKTGMTITVSDELVADLKTLHGIDAVTEIVNSVTSELELELEQQKEPERRVFTIDVGNMTPEQAKEAITAIQNKYAALDSAYNPMTMGEDYFFAPAPKKKFMSTKTFNTDRGLSCCFRQWRATHSHCSTLHGYSIGVKFVFECEELDERNWVFDFGGLKDIKKWLEHMFDHTCCCCRRRSIVGTI